MSGIINSAGSKSGLIGETETAIVAGSASFLANIGSATAWGSYSHNAVLPFDNDSGGAAHDTDSCYDTSAYKFTAPATGVYIFYFAVMTAESRPSNAFQFKKDGGSVNVTYHGADFVSYSDLGSGDHIQQGTLIIPLNSDSYIQVCAAQDNVDAYLQLSFWGGCRLK